MALESITPWCGRLLAIVALLGAGLSCSGGSGEARSGPALLSPRAFAAEHPGFARFWTRGLAELTRYELSQARYGAVHEGEAVLVFVTEPFLPDRQVKDDDGDAEHAVQVLKLNAYRRFYTGVYPYTVLTSTFTPTDDVGAAALKVSTSVQEWCGHVYAQLNRRPAGYRLTSHSYFEAEGDQQLDVADALLEDQLFTRIRRDPSSLPTGPAEVIPAMHHLRFAHRPVAPRQATLALSEPRPMAGVDGPVRTYTVRYADGERVLRVHFEVAFPHGIAGWEEEGRGGLVTRARRTHGGMLDYWSHHAPEDAPLRQQLGLAF